eukprot:6486407-Amphidinium_carterae.2
MQEAQSIGMTSHECVSHATWHMIGTAIRSSCDNVMLSPTTGSSVTHAVLTPAIRNWVDNAIHGKVNCAQMPTGSTSFTHLSNNRKLPEQTPVRVMHDAGRATRAAQLEQMKTEVDQGVSPSTVSSSAT